MTVALPVAHLSSTRETSIVVAIELFYFFTYFFKSFGPTSAP